MAFISCFNCTKVPEAARGVGIGGQLAKAAIDWAAGRKRDQAESGGDGEVLREDAEKHVVLSCSFLKRWHQLNPTPGHNAVVLDQS